MSYLLLLPFLVIVSTIDNNIPFPRVLRNISLPQIKTVPSKHRFVLSFDDINYEISGAVYEKEG
jgi:hypothetical protein